MPTDVLYLGATISRIEEEQFQVFAPNSQVLQVTVEKISELTREEVSCRRIVATFSKISLISPGITEMMFCCQVGLM